MLKSTMNRWNADISFIHSNEFLSISRGENLYAFTRKRKLPLPMVVLSMLSRKGLTLKMELRNFIKKSKLKSISKVGYLKQRMKLNPLAIKILNEHHVNNYYNNCDYLKTWNGFIITAIDGSDLNLPTTRETLSYFGNACRKGWKEKAQAGISCLYDCLNRIIIDVTVNKCKFDERGQAMVHLERLSKLTNKKTIVIMDRGYPGIKLILFLMDKKQPFLMRIDKTTYRREQKSMLSQDEYIEIIFDQTRMNPYRGTELEKRMKELKSIRLRFVKISLSSGEDEYLITNIDTNVLRTEQIYELYGMRWGVETAYDELKNKLQLENFTGTKPILIEQDIYTSVYLLNLMQDIIQDAEYGLNIKEKKYKYKMVINRNLAFGIIKEELLNYILDEDKKEDKFYAIIKEIQSELVPVRKDRSYKRSKGQLVSKHSNTHKRSY